LAIPFQASSEAIVQSTRMRRTSPASTHGRLCPIAWAARIFCVRVMGRRLIGLSYNYKGCKILLLGIPPGTLAPMKNAFNRSLRVRVLAAALALTVFQSGCFGSFKLTQAVWKFNKNVARDKWVQWLVFL